MFTSFLVNTLYTLYFFLYTIFMLTYYQAIIFGIIQGVTELFPISSLGHSVLLPSILEWHIDQNNSFFLTFLVATHTATALVLFLFFWKDWKRIITGFLYSLKIREIKDSDKDAKLAWLLVVATIPAGIIGLVFQAFLQNLFASPQLVAFVLILNGFLLLGAEQLKKKNLKFRESDIKSNERITKISWSQAIKIGLLQCFALIPGFSRTGATITGGLLVGLSHEDSARFAFLLATPIIAAASLLKLPDVFAPEGLPVLGPTLVGAFMAGIAAYFSVKFLTKYFETKNLKPFALYCIILGFVVSLFLFSR